MDTSPTNDRGGGKVILSLCDYSGEWPRPYREAGYKVVQVDLRNGHDVRLLQLKELPKKVHGILAAPPCTHLSNAGAVHWKKKGTRALLSSLGIVDACLRFVCVYNPEWWCLENPVGRINHYLGKPTMIFQPYEFGDAYTKRTCLWGKFNTELKRTPVEPTHRLMGGNKKNKIYRLPEITAGRYKAEIRSTTPAGFARAFFEANP